MKIHYIQNQSGTYIHTDSIIEIMESLRKKAEETMIEEDLSEDFMDGVGVAKVHVMEEIKALKTKQEIDSIYEDLENRGIKI